ncbi:MAG: hypothetical protein NTV46_01640 [Verrucomicrobia bacterium]|nr:hypothetical protein [Verrucomicrobiota bacterium]
MPVPGYISPPKETLDVTNSGNLTLDRVYYETMMAGNGGLTVRLKPDGLGAQWRFAGESDWRDSGGPPLSGLVAGSYLIECKPVAGRVTPPTASISIVEGDSRELTLTYFTANNPVGAAPLPLAFGSVSADEDMPFAFVGQIRSEVGSSTGFVVKRRVVATAGHVVFDDGTLSYITGMQWLFQRHAGQHEPQPQVPRGYYLAAGYAAQRIADASPGEGSAQSQHLDYAALYLLEEAGRGGYGGFLATDSGDDNEFLGSTAEKILAGYAVEVISETDKGKLHATAAFSAALTPAYGETWTSTAVRGLGGCSGGPLFVRRSNGLYYPAAIYLGGSGQTVVRAINSEVVELFNRAETSGNGGDNNTGGGITHTSVTSLGTTTQAGAIKVTIEPEAARSANAGWRLKPVATYLHSGVQIGGLNPNTYILEFKTVSGFQIPTQQTVLITGSQLREVTFTYLEAFTPLQVWRQTHFGTPNNIGIAADTADPDGDGRSNISEFAAATDPNNAADVFRVLTATKSGAGFTVTAAGKATRTYVLERNTNLAAGPWTSLGILGPLAADGPVVLTDNAAPDGKAFYRIQVSAP